MGKLLRQIFGQETIEGRLRDLNNKMQGIPVDLANPMMDQLLERSYLEEVCARELKQDLTINKVAWVKLQRLPLHPSQDDQYDLLLKWQQALGTMHAWNEKVVFILQRQRGETSLYIGLTYNNSRFQEATSRLQTALENCMPGIEIETLDEELPEGCQRMSANLRAYSVAGAITGIPSVREAVNVFSDSQTLDRISFGVRHLRQEFNRTYQLHESNYSLVIVADPLKDSLVTETTERLMRIGNDIHALVNLHVSSSDSLTDTRGTTTSINVNMDLSQIIQTLAACAGMPIPEGGGTSSANSGVTPVGGNVFVPNGGGGHHHGMLSLGLSRAWSNFDTVSTSESVTKDYLNKFAKATEEHIDQHCERMKQGRNYGLWNVAVNVLADTDDTLCIVQGMLRSIYSGGKTYLEPIRLHKLHSSAIPTISNFNFIPILAPNVRIEGKEDTDEWHVLGRIYQYVSTPLTTEELSIVSSLPRKDVPGIRFVRTAARFACNPSDCKSEDALTLGHIVDCGVELTNEYKIDINTLVKHALVVGSTGSGKTTTCKRILNEVDRHGIPMLVIEPAKDEYVRWAVEQNKHRSAEERINIFMPGMNDLWVYGELNYRPKRLKLNPFQPASVKGAPVDLLARTEQFAAIFNSCVPTNDVLPVLIDESFHRFMLQRFGDDLMRGDVVFSKDTIPEFPLLENILPVAQQILKEKNYSDEIARGLMAALTTRFLYVCRGNRGRILNVHRSTPVEELFKKTCVINLSRIPNNSDKQLIMSLLLLELFEYDTSAYLYDIDRSSKEMANKLMHFTVIEEAHNVLKQPSARCSGDGSAEEVVAGLFSNMLSEVRSCGEGLMIVDQVPTRLVADVIRNTNLKIVHKLSGADDCMAMCQALGLIPGQEGLIPLLPTGNVLIAGDRDDAASWLKIFR